MSQNNNEVNSEGRFSLDRLNALSDGIIAIAITILVLDIHVPEGHDFNLEGLRSFFKKIEPGLLAYVSSFVIIAIYWIMQNRIYRFIKSASQTIIILNITFLFSITLVPFVSKIKTLYYLDPYAITLLASVHIFTGLILFFTWKHIKANKELLKSPESNYNDKWITRSILISPIVCVIAIFVSFYDAYIGTYLFTTIPFIYFFITKRYKI